ncbi:MAG: GAK system CofD-like protein [Aestuariibacter sp.]
MSNQYFIKRGLKIPDKLRIARYERSPEMGPSILFFSGGTALNDLSKKLKKFTHNSIHMMTPFDSGGSSAVLRQSFDMPAIGDLRARLMALADDSVKGLPDVFALFSHRLSKTSPHPVLEKQLFDMTQGVHSLVAAIPEPMRQLICNQLAFFQSHKPDNFNLRGASVGNLILSGGYLNNTRHLEPIVFLFSKLVEVRGTVRLTVDDNFHLAVELENGDVIVGQHRMTGKEKPPISKRIKRMFLSRNIDQLQPVESVLCERQKQLIINADMICFPPGSYYSSVLASLLPKGVGKAIYSNQGPKVFIPNLGEDPEMLGMDVNDAIQTLLDYIQQDLEHPVPENRLLSHIVIDKNNEQQQETIDRVRWQQHGMQIVETNIISKSSAPFYDTDALLSVLLSFC